MNRVVSRVFSTLAMAFLTAQAKPASCQTNFPGNIIFDVIQNAEPGGSVSYTVRPLVFGIAMPKILTAPDGTQFGSGPLFDNQHTVATFAELEQRFFGTWGLREDSPFSPAEDSTYAFTFGPFSLDNVFHATPLITTPADGATVPSSFFVEWEYPSGALPSGRSLERRQSGATPTFDAHPTPRARLDVDSGVLAGGRLDFRAGSTDSLSPYVSGVTLVSGPPRSAYTIQSTFRNYSLYATVTVVPEPSTAAFAGCIGVLALRSRRWRAAMIGLPTQR